MSAALAAAPVDATVLVLQGPATCAGAFVDDAGHVATAYHCVAGGGHPRIETRDGRRAVGRVIAVDPGADLAVIAVADLAGSPHLAIRTEPPVLGEHVHAIGHPFGSRLPGGFLTGLLRWSVSEGVVSGLGPRAVQTTAPVNPGNSGGPVVDMDGRVIGVVSRRLRGDGLGFAGRSSDLAALLADPNGFGPVGGTVGGSLYVMSWSGDSGALSYGIRGELSFRDRVFVDVGGAAPFGARLDALELGSVAWTGLESRIGLRQRLFRGAATTSLSGWAGLVTVNRVEAEASTTGGARVDIDYGRDVANGWMVGGTLAFPGLGFGVDVGWVTTGHEEALRAGFVFTWPGTVWVF